MHTIINRIKILSPKLAQIIKKKQILMNNFDIKLLEEF